MSARYRQVLGLLTAALLQASALAAEPMCWNRLVFEASNGWASATSTVSYSRLPASALPADTAPAGRTDLLRAAGTELTRIDVGFEAMRSRGELAIWLDPATSRVLLSERLSRGSDSRLKTHRFLEHGVLRTRREADGRTSGGDPSKWRISSRGVIDYPVDVGAEDGVLSPIVLLGAAVEMAVEGRAKSEHLVFADTQLYRVALTDEGTEPVELRFSVSENGHETGVDERVQAHRISLHPELLGSASEDEAFSLLELGGKLAIMVDPSRALPVEVRGSWFRVGTVAAALKRAGATRTPDNACLQ